MPASRPRWAALRLLDPEINEQLSQDDLKQKRYGQSTHDMVLKYKTARGIINYSYQDAPDAVVGIMTITRLDKEVAEKERQLPALIQTLRVKAFGRCMTAWQRLTGFGLPPQPAWDLRQQARRAAENIFDWDPPNMEQIERIVSKMRNTLADPRSELFVIEPFVGGPHRDWSGFVEDNRPPIHLGLNFFLTDEEHQIRNLIHESAHVAGICSTGG